MASFILGVLFLGLSSIVIRWMKDPRVLALNGHKVGLIYPVFAVDTIKNPDSINIFMDLINNSLNDLKSDKFVFSDNPD
jgi:hypothetical protein